MIRLCLLILHLIMLYVDLMKKEVKRSIQFKDSYLLLPHSIRDLCRDFNLKEKKKVISHIK